jgi:hypothetical protein
VLLVDTRLGGYRCCRDYEWIQRSHTSRTTAERVSAPSSRCVCAALARAWTRRRCGRTERVDSSEAEESRPDERADSSGGGGSRRRHGTAILRVIVAGERDPAASESARRDRRCRKSEAEIAEQFGATGPPIICSACSKRRRCMTLLRTFWPTTRKSSVSSGRWPVRTRSGC